jgi:hypothetical protein
MLARHVMPPRIHRRCWLEFAAYACLVLNPGDLIGQVTGQRIAAGPCAQRRQERSVLLGFVSVSRLRSQS